MLLYCADMVTLVQSASKLQAEARWEITYDQDFWMLVKECQPFKSKVFPVPWEGDAEVRRNLLTTKHNTYKAKHKAPTAT